MSFAILRCDRHTQKALNRSRGWFRSRILVPYRPSSPQKKYSMVVCAWNFTCWDVWRKFHITETGTPFHHEFCFELYSPPCRWHLAKQLVNLGPEYGMDWVETIQSSPKPRATGPNPVQSSWWPRIWIQSSPIRTQQSRHLPNTLQNRHVNTNDDVCVAEDLRVELQTLELR